MVETRRLAVMDKEQKATWGPRSCDGFQHRLSGIGRHRIPLQQLGRFALCVWNFFCVPPSPPDFHYYSHAYYYDDDESGYDSNSSSVGVGGFSGYVRNPIRIPTVFFRDYMTLIHKKKEKAEKILLIISKTHSGPSKPIVAKEKASIEEKEESRRHERKRGGSNKKTADASHLKWCDYKLTNENKNVDMFTVLILNSFGGYKGVIVIGRDSIRYRSKLDMSAKLIVVVILGCSRRRHLPYVRSMARVCDIGLNGNGVSSTDDFFVEDDGGEGERTSIVDLEGLLGDVEWTCVFCVPGKG
ncbi:hypothetical protein LXL04_022089 [Taraxacum kok-saghyz]